MQQGSHLVGLTTAATIWLSASLGMAVGAGYYLLSIIGVAIVMVILLAFPKIEEWIYRAQVRENYKVTFDIENDRREQLADAMQESGLRITNKKVTRSSGEMCCEWEAEGTPENHDRFVERLLVDKSVLRFEC